MKNSNKQTTIKSTEQIELLKLLLKDIPGKSRNNIKSILARGQVSINNKVIRQYNHIVKAGQEVLINWNIEELPEGLNIVYEDEDIIVINKQSGLLSIATTKENQQTAYSILSDHIKKRDQKNRIFIVHRLDKETSGLMLFAKSQTIKDKLQNNWQEVVIERSYVVVVEGCVEKDDGVISSWLTEGKNMIMYSSKTPNEGKKAITQFCVLKKNNNYSLLEVKLKTGRKNQIRVHMKDLKHSVIGDKKYGTRTNPINRLGLHARVLTFIHPVTGEEKRFQTDIPKEFKQLFK
jgi:23S rRNA pseudouridine1911/1915/1917 synthase